MTAPTPRLTASRSLARADFSFLRDSPGQTDIVRTETFAPLLYVLSYDSFEEAIAMQNDVDRERVISAFRLTVRRQH